MPCHTWNVSVLLHCHPSLPPPGNVNNKSNAGFKNLYLSVCKWDWAASPLHLLEKQTNLSPVNRAGFPWSRGGQSCLCSPAGPCSIFIFFLFLNIFRDWIKVKSEFWGAASQRCKVHMGANPTPLSWSFCVLQGWEGSGLAVASQCYWEQTGSTGVSGMEEGQNAASGCCTPPHHRVLFITHPKKCYFLLIFCLPFTITPTLGSFRDLAQSLAPSHSFLLLGAEQRGSGNSFQLGELEKGLHPLFVCVDGEFLILISVAQDSMSVCGGGVCRVGSTPGLSPVLAVQGVIKIEIIVIIITLNKDCFWLFIIFIIFPFALTAVLRCPQDTPWLWWALTSPSDISTKSSWTCCQFVTKMGGTKSGKKNKIFIFFNQVTQRSFPT